VTTATLLVGAVLLALALVDRPLSRLPLSPALIYLAIGWAAGAVLGVPDAGTREAQLPVAVMATEFAVLISLLAVGLRLRTPATLGAWRVALLLAGPGMVVTIALAMAAAHLLLGLPWPAALLVAAVLAPTDPVLASEVQITSDEDRDAVRLSLTAEGGLNDGSALPGVMLALGLLGLHAIGPQAIDWWWHDLVWPIGGGLALGTGLGFAVGRLLRRRIEAGDGVARDELLYVAVVAIGYAVARALGVSTFVTVFSIGATLLLPLRDAAVEGSGRELTQRMHAFGARVERLVEASMVLAVGVLLHTVHIGLAEGLFAVVLLAAVRPLSVLAVVRGRRMPPRQRRLVAWFGIRGIGSLYYLAYALEQGLPDGLAERLVAATLCCVALSIVLHGMSATPLMREYQRRRGGTAT
jgi:NhaP-type Na+/H+ or K+/H+ antiporter